MHPTLLAVVSHPDTRSLHAAERAGAVIFIAALTAAAAQISVPLPFTPVPFTFQPMIVLIGSAALGARLAMTSQLLYLALGVAGLPVFAASPMLPQGIGRLLGPTGGYLMAYPLAAFVSGWLAERGYDRRYVTAVVSMASGLAVIFTGGVTWLALFVPPARGFAAALAAGFFPFVLGDLIKLLLAAGVMPSLWWLSGRPRWETKNASD
jgi:biotin transport system substrate-specific component